MSKSSKTIKTHRKQRGTRAVSGETRQLILRAATKRISEGGPAAIRLTEIARDIGVSHPTILHHFGSRAGLIEAIEEDRTKRLLDEISKLLSKPVAESTPALLIRRVFEVLGDSGHARLWAWRGLTLGEGEHGQAEQAMLQQLTDAVHARRAEYARVHELDVPTREDSSFVLRLLNATLLGEAVAGSTFDHLAELDGQRDAQQRFRSWLGELLTLHINGGVRRDSEEDDDAKLRQES